jgi:hypothetical protein
MPSLIPMDHPGTYIQWGWFSMSVGNLVIIILMLAVFIAALFARFPRGGRQ